MAASQGQPAEEHGKAGTTIPLSLEEIVHILHLVVDPCMVQTVSPPSRSEKQFAAGRWLWRLGLAVKKSEGS